MKETLKKHATKSFGIRTAVVAVILIVSLVFTKAGIISLLFGGTSIDGTADFDALEGKQVSFDANYIVAEYVRRTSTNTDTNRTTLTNVGYIVWDYDNDVMFGIYLPASKSSQMDDMIDETWEWVDYEIDEVSSTLHVDGTLRTMEGKEFEYFQETIDEILYEDEQDIVRYYTIDTTQVNGIEKGWLALISALDMWMLIYFIWSLVSYLSQGYYRAVKKFLDANPSIPESRMEADFASAVLFEKKIWVGKEWTIYIKGMKSYLMENRKQVWAYYYQRTGRYAESKIRFFDCDKKNTNIDIPHSKYEEMLKAYQERQPQMLLGYDKEWEKMYKKNFSEFLNLRYNQVISQVKTEDTYGYQGQANPDNYFDDARYNMDAYREQQGTELCQVELTAAGKDTIQVIKVIRDMTGLGLAEAKNLVDVTPSIIKQTGRKEAEEIKNCLLYTSDAADD